MKRIILMRHAKSERKEPYLTDHDRPLSMRGRKDATKMARDCIAKGFIPDLILISDAKRTLETWQLISPFFQNTKVFFTNDLYLASSEKIINIISQTDSLIDCIMILAHNPGITDTFLELANIKIDNVPTAGIGCISSFTKSFKNITTETNQLEYFIYPKM